MERRDFCRLLCGAAAVGCTTYLAGCARLLDWSAAQHVGDARELSMAPGFETTGGSTPDATTDATSSAEPTTTPPPGPTPDLAVATGNDPGANVRAALAIMGGMERFVKRDARVVVKPNLLTTRAPEYAATTNPDVVAAIVELCYEAGAAEVTLLDRSTADTRQAFEVSGIAAAAEGAGAKVKILTDRNYENVAIPQGRLLTAWPLVTDVFEADTFINVPIAKHHGLATLTLSMKNLMGIMGGQRGFMHQEFHTKIVDLNTLVKPHLIVLDAYRILTAHGPSGGNLADVKMPKTVVVGTNQVAVDAYATSFFGLEPRSLPYLLQAKERGLGETDVGKLTIVREAV